MGDWVLLRHDMPDGSWHLDWLIEREAGAIGAQRTGTGSGGREPTHTRPDSRVLLSLRVEGADGAGGRLFDPRRGDGRVRRAERLPDHRRMYLNFEGVLPVGEDGSARGRVTRVASGAGWIEIDEPGRLRVRVEADKRRPAGESGVGPSIAWVATRAAPRPGTPAARAGADAADTRWSWELREQQE